MIVDFDGLYASVWTGKKFELRKTNIHYQNSTVVRVLGSGLCGTDRHLMMLPAFNERSFGHEIFAEIVRIGSFLNSVGGHELKPGDKVVVTPGVPCMECVICTTYSGHEHMCNSRRSHGFAKYSSEDFFPIGGFSNYMELVDDLWVVKIEDDLTFDEAMFAEPVAIATKAVERGMGGTKQEIEFGPGVAMRAAVIGLGPIGCATTFVLKSLGAEVVGFEVNDWKSTLVGDIFKFSTFTVPEESNDAFDVVKNKTDLDFDLVIDCTGSPRGLELGIKFAKRGGRIVEVGSFAPGTRSFINPADICKKELEVLGSALSPVFTYNKVLRLLRKFKQYDLNRLTTHHLSLSSMDNLFQIVDENRFLKIHVDTNLD